MTGQKLFKSAEMLFRRNYSFIDETSLDLCEQWGDVVVTLHFASVVQVISPE